MYNFSIIMGSDSFQNLAKWKNYEYIVNNYPIHVYERPGFEVNNSLKANILQTRAPLLELSATHIRQLIADGKSIRYMLPEKVKEEIERGNYYRPK